MMPLPDLIGSCVLVVIVCLGILTIYGLASKRAAEQSYNPHGPVWPEGHPDHPEVENECRCGRPGTPEEHLANGAN